MESVYLWLQGTDSRRKSKHLCEQFGTWCRVSVQWMATIIKTHPAFYVPENQDCLPGWPSTRWLRGPREVMMADVLSDQGRYKRHEDASAFPVLPVCLANTAPSTDCHWQLLWARQPSLGTRSEPVKGLPSGASVCGWRGAGGANPEQGKTDSFWCHLFSCFHFLDTVKTSYAFFFQFVYCILSLRSNKCLGHDWC